MNKSLELYNDYIINLYNQKRSISYIINALHKNCNTRLKAHNKKSGGMWYEFIERHTKAECSGHVYDVIYRYIRSNKQF